MNMDDSFDDAELAFLAKHYSVSDEELAARVRAAPDMGGALLVELSEFMATREEQK
jgi:hypothetical protein